MYDIICCYVHTMLVFVNMYLCNSFSCLCRYRWNDCDIVLPQRILRLSLPANCALVVPEWHHSIWSFDADALSSQPLPNDTVACNTCRLLLHARTLWRSAVGSCDLDKGVLEPNCEYCDATGRYHGCLLSHRSHSVCEPCAREVVPWEV